MAMQTFLGRGQLIDRLTAQVGNRAMAIKILQDRGQLNADGKTFTAGGSIRNNMTAEERAKDRAAKRLKEAPFGLSYNPKTNTARKKHGNR